MCADDPLQGQEREVHLENKSSLRVARRDVAAYMCYEHAQI